MMPQKEFYQIYDNTRSVGAMVSWCSNDEQASVFTRWQENDGRPDKIGQFRQMTQLQLDQSKIPPTDKIFRVAGWDVALVVSEEIKNRLKDESVTGLGFVEV